MLLLRDGRRVPDGTRGKHIVLGGAAAAWLMGTGTSGQRLAQSFRTARKARNKFEYPDAQAPLPSDDELRGMTLDNVRIVELARGEMGLPKREGVVPTPDNIDAWERDRI